MSQTSYSSDGSSASGATGDSSVVSDAESTGVEFDLSRTWVVHLNAKYLMHGNACLVAMPGSISHVNSQSVLAQIRQT